MYVLRKSINKREATIIDNIKIKEHNNRINDEKV